MNENIMAYKPVRSTIWKLGIPMVLSMILQSLYNVIDTIFVINMGEQGTKANLALTYAFPIQILMIAISVGTGIGINALLSKSLGEKDEEKTKKIVGNAIFLGVIISIIFLIFGLFFTDKFIRILSSDAETISLGSTYLKICCCLCFGCIGFAIYERFLQASGKTSLSMIAQISGAVINIVLDYVFIYPLNMGIKGAAYATVIGQIASLIICIILHYTINKEVKNSFEGLKPNSKIIKAIYKVGWSAMLMQALLAISMFVLTAIMGLNAENGVLIQGTYGIYYKIYQIPLMACFGLSNALITLLSFNLGMNKKDRVRSILINGVIDTAALGLIFTIIFEIFAKQIATLFGLASGTSNNEIIELCKTSIQIASIGYIFMGFSIGVQGELQANQKAMTPLITALLRLIVFVIPFAFIFIYSKNPTQNIWWSFPIGEFLTAIVSLFIFIKLYKKSI